MNATSPSPPSRSGCGAFLLCTLVTCLLLIPNGWLAIVSVGSILGLAPVLLDSPKIGQVLVFVLPVLLTVIEWWAFDRLRDVWKDRRSRRGPA